MKYLMLYRKLVYKRGTCLMTDVLKNKKLPWETHYKTSSKWSNTNARGCLCWEGKRGSYPSTLIHGDRRCNSCPSYWTLSISTIFWKGIFWHCRQIGSQKIFWGQTSRAVLLNLFDPIHPFKKQLSAIHPHHSKSSYFRKLKLGDNDIGCIL